MNKNLLLNALSFGTLWASLGTVINLLPFLIFGSIQLVNKVGIAVCIMIGIGGAIAYYKTLRKYYS